MNKNWNELAPKLQGIMDEATSSRQEAACQLAIYDHGKLVINLASGYYDESKERPVTADTLFPIFSCGKAIMATAMHRLVAKGLVSYDTRIADIWPEFGCNGKEDTRLWHFMTHRSALQALPLAQPCSEEITNWELMCSKLANATPAWTPGGKCAYHGVTFAWLMGETAARVTGKSVNNVIREEVLAPLSLEKTFFYGTTDEAEKQFIPIDSSDFDNNTCWCADFINNPVIRHACIPSANAVTNAKSLAKHYAALIGEVDGVRLLSPEIIENATILRRSEDDPIPPEGTWALFGLGYALVAPPPNRGMRFGHGGAAGSEGFADKENGIAFAFTKNKALQTHPIHPIRDRISQALGLPNRVW